MLMCIHRSLFLLLCVGLLASHPQQVSARLRGIDPHMMIIKNHRMLMEADTNTLPTEKKSADDHAFDPYQSSKRKVRRGSDPIHNRT